MDTDHLFGTVVLLGPPNAGKSTLLNKYLGQKIAIVTPKPQTTRNRISGILTLADAQIVFLDTPGVHGLKGEMNRSMLQCAWSCAASAEVTLILLDGALLVRRPQALEDGRDRLLQWVRETKKPVFIAVNKADLIKDKSALLPLFDRLSKIRPQAEVFPISAKTGLGLDNLLGKIKKALPQGPAMFPEDQLSTVPLRFMAAEIIREKLFLSLRRELPYFVAVEIESWEEDAGDNLTRIGALIYVSKDTHKAMVIGKGGKNLKDLGREARIEIKELVGTKVFLRLWVKVRKKWTEDPSFLRALGLGA
ncbi:MAG: GTPase Era [Thermodesulfobacteriota bacterium]|nr:GTPase Era [Thermodesulfobacteriota bacterium]